MAKHLQIEIGRLKRRILHIGAYVEESFQSAVVAVTRRDAELAQRVLATHYEVDTMEVDLEEECLKVLALYQPVARDLRFIVSVLKVNNDLERIGDLAENIAGRALSLAQHQRFEIPYDFVGMAESARTMLHGALDALANLDAGVAYEVCAADDRVDTINRDMYRKIKSAMLENPERIDALLHLLSASRYVERVADHATNVAEDVIYLLEGGIVRHRLQNRRDGGSSGPEDIA
jgi:phosphate transport system protein